MHIAFLTPEYPHKNLGKSGGLGTSIKNLAKGLVTEHVNVTVFVIGQSNDFEIEDEGINLISISREEHAVFNWYFERKRLQKLLQKRINLLNIDLIEAKPFSPILILVK